jgi:hypothetical protein
MDFKASGTLRQSNEMVRHLIMSTNSYTSTLHEAAFFGHVIKQLKRAILPEANKQLNCCVGSMHTCTPQ